MMGPRWRRTLAGSRRDTPHMKLVPWWRSLRQRRRKEKGFRRSDGRHRRSCDKIFSYEKSGAESRRPRSLRTCSGLPVPKRCCLSSPPSWHGAVTGCGQSSSAGYFASSTARSPSNRRQSRPANQRRRRRGTSSCAKMLGISPSAWEDVEKNLPPESQDPPSRPRRRRRRHARPHNGAYAQLKSIRNRR